jgi:hypothetical protein
MAFFKGLNLRMIIYRSQINEVVISVTDQSTILLPIYYLFEFKRKESNVKSYCIAQVATSYTDRQLFNIEETDTPDPLTAKVKLKAGSYEYKVYQQTDATNVDPTNTIVAASGFATVDAGILTVIETTTAPIEYKGANSTNPVYEQ